MTRQTRKLFYSTFFAALMLGAAPLSAMAAANSAEPEIYFYPAQGWSIAQKDKSCNITSQFNNGFIMSFSGGEKWVQGLDINFRQNIFEAEKNYDVTLSIPGIKTQTIKANVKGTDTLAMSLRRDKDFYQALRKAAVLDLTLEGNNFRFYLTGFSQSAGQFETCMAAASVPEGANDTAGNFMVNESIALEAKAKNAPTSMVEISPTDPQPVVQEIPYKETLKVGDKTVAKMSSDDMLPAILDTEVEAVVPAPAPVADSTPQASGRKRLSEQLAEQIASNPALIEVDNTNSAPSAPRRALEMPPNMDALAPLPPADDELTPVPKAERIPASEQIAPEKKVEAEIPAAVVVKEERAPEVITFDAPPVAVSAAPEPMKMAETQEEAPQDSVAEEAVKAETETPAPAPSMPPIEEAKPEPIHKSTPPMKVNRQYMTSEADFTNIEPSSYDDGATQELRKQVIELENTVEMLKGENTALNGELKSSLRESEEERLNISSENWNLERATMKFNEAERQISRLGQQLQREKAKCSTEKRDLEAMLFDPKVTNEAQLASLAGLEEQLREAERALEDQRIRYEERIRALEGVTQ